MQSPGFEIYNDTIWPMQIALKQLGPLYYDVVQPKQYFRRTTGAVWFTIDASISLDGKNHITTWDCVWPIASIVGGVALGALTGGFGAFAALGTAASTTGVSATVASCLVAGGATATQAIVVSGVALGAAGAVAGAAPDLLASVFTSESASVSLAGCYAGAPWPFNADSKVHTYKVSGGPTATPAGNDKVNLAPAPLLLS